MDINLNVTISAPGIENALNAVATIFSKTHLMPAAPAAVEPRRGKDKTEKPVKAETPVEEASTAPTKAEPEKVEDAAPATPEHKKDDAPKVTLEQVRDKLQAVTKNGKKDQVQALIASYDVKKLTDIPADKFAEVLEKAEAL